MTARKWLTRNMREAVWLYFAPVFRWEFWAVMILIVSVLGELFEPFV
jgi:hypothetical protein